MFNLFSQRNPNTPDTPSRKGKRLNEAESVSLKTRLSVASMQQVKEDEDSQGGQRSDRLVFARNPHKKSTFAPKCESIAQACLFPS